MNFEFSNRISGVKASAIREILKMMNDPEIISFGGGNPASETFPVEQLKRISDDIFNTCPTYIKFGFTIPFILAKYCTVVPNLVAIPLNVSPDCTT